MELKPEKLTKQDEYWRGKAYSFLTHPSCEAYPCHADVDAESFNCLFCYCPLYALDDKCGGNYKYLKSGIKDCSDCTLPHDKDNYGYVVDRFNDIADMMKKARERNP